MRRFNGSLILMTAALAIAGPAHGASIVTEGGTKYAYYELVNTRPTPVSDLVLAGVVPPTAVVPADPTLGPLTIVRGSSGFDANNLSVITSPPGSDPAGIGFDFTNPSNPLAAGGVLNFKVSLDPNYNLTSTPALTLQPPDADLVLFSYTPVSPNAGPGADPAPNTPEPASLALWSALAGVALFRVRAYRKARALAPA
ncbi:hypothetical protein P12x_002847 [Tundrisphaera lichenicola]|uniref:hypothetical protein n=1 Tax=Tundrisphaera lichenicola TaxID=2029860 RepID=UPI003EB84BD3